MHLPVMLQEVLEVMNLHSGMTVLDGTVGLGGHSAEIARVIGTRGTLLATDRDPAMLVRAAAHLATVSGGPRVIAEVMPYEQAPALLQREGISGVDAACLDLGVNSEHVDDPARGLTFRVDAGLDGRFNPAEAGTPTIADLVNSASEADLARWIADYGEERHARRIAMAIVLERAKTPITRTVQLADIIRAAYPAKDRHTSRIDPATRTMQALRIAANDELGGVERGVRAILGILRPGACLAVLSFHSLEDRLVKGIFDEVGAPRRVDHDPYRATSTEGLDYVLETRGARKPTEEEVAANPRSRSARLRWIRRREEVAA